MPERDLGRRGNNGVVFRNGIMDFAADVLLGHAQQGGLSPGALLAAFRRIHDGDPESWVSVFTDVARRTEASACHAEDHAAAQIAWRAVLMMLDPRTAAAVEATRRMEDSFGRFVDQADVPLERRSIPFGDALLPAYVSPGVADADRMTVVIGGGDTYVEDLWFFGGAEVVRRGRPVLMVDLPGQGSTPAQGLHFGPGTLRALRAVFDDLHARGFSGEVVLLGWSGGGIFTTAYAASARPEDRIVALVASTPVHDAQALFRAAMPALLRGREHSRLVGALTTIARRNRMMAASMAKYDWQFGPEGLAGVVETFGPAYRVDLTTLDLPVLALVGSAEAVESARQAAAVVQAAARHHPASRVVTFDPWSGGAAHCQVGNVPLAMRAMFDWLDDLPAPPV